MATWTKEAVQILIDAYKNEPCLYQTKSPNYHNKNLRYKALKRICAIVNTIRPNTTEKECSVKFYNLRSQFNSENAKVRASIKSGTGTENVYKPNLWYYNSLSFVEEHIIPRKSRTSPLPNTKTNTPTHLLQHDYSQASEESQQSILNLSEVLFEDDNFNVHNEEDLSNNNNNEESQLCMSSSPNNITNNINTATQPTLEQINLQLRSPFTNFSNINTSSPSKSCSTSSFVSTSTSSSAKSSNVCDMSQSSSVVRNPKKRKFKNDDVYVEAIESIAQSLKMPVSTPVNITTENTDPIDTCMSFLGSLLKRIQSSDIKLDVMNTLVQTVINASVTDSERSKK